MALAAPPFLPAALGLAATPLFLAGDFLVLVAGDFLVAAFLVGLFLTAGLFLVAVVCSREAMSARVDSILTRPGSMNGVQGKTTATQKPCTSGKHNSNYAGWNAGTVMAI